MAARRPIALVTGASRRAGIGAAIALELATRGWDLAITSWRAYDERMPWGSRPDDEAGLLEELATAGARHLALEADLADPETPARVVTRATEELGPVRALVMSHCESIDSDLHDTSVASFDLHMAVNARATWQLIQAFAHRFDGPHGTGRIVALTSDHTAGNLPYGASKGAMDRIVLAAAIELADRGITANVINPGATDSGWMDDELREAVQRRTLLGRVGRPQDAANLAGFLCSPEGGWINGQLLYSNGGLRP